MPIYIVSVGSDKAVIVKGSTICTYDPQCDDPGCNDMLEEVAVSLGNLQNEIIIRKELPTHDEWNWSEIIERHNLNDSKSSSMVTLADFEIRDWHLIEYGDGWTGPKEHRDTYRFVIEQAPNCKDINFSIYPKVLDGLSDNIERNGLSGRIEIRNGKPAISLGTDDNNLPVHIESDIYHGLYIHPDRNSEPEEKNVIV